MGVCVCVYFFPSNMFTVNREINEVMSGTLPVVGIESNCRCPESLPRINPANISTCLPNGPETGVASDRLVVR